MRLHVSLLAAGLLILSKTSLTAAPITGHWLTHKANAMVKITRCGEGLCGRIVWLRASLDARGNPVRDARNRDKRFRGRQVLGLTTFSGLAPAGPGRWSGVMYNPDDGRIYRASLTLLDSGSIRVEGCRLGGGLCGKRSWTRAQTKISARIAK
ncbi:hypothetical protein BMS3Bbin10_01145 [bacterium BMS3Bbin10]|nr:hypothetical protein BMS3Bbin10_01145 [bacterium BMS3Bbin10]